MSKKLTLEEVLERAKQSYLEKEKRANDRKAQSAAILETDREQARNALLAIRNLSKKAQRELKPVLARLRAFCRGIPYSEYIHPKDNVSCGIAEISVSAEEEEER